MSLSSSGSIVNVTTKKSRKYDSISKSDEYFEENNTKRSKIENIQFKTKPELILSVFRKLLHNNITVIALTKNEYQTILDYQDQYFLEWTHTDKFINETNTQSKNSINNSFEKCNFCHFYSSFDTHVAYLKEKKIKLLNTCSSCKNYNRTPNKLWKSLTSASSTRYITDINSDFIKKFLKEIIKEHEKFQKTKDNSALKACIDNYTNEFSKFKNCHSNSEIAKFILTIGIGLGGDATFSNYYYPIPKIITLIKDPTLCKIKEDLPYQYNTLSLCYLNKMIFKDCWNYICDKMDDDFYRIEMILLFYKVRFNLKICNIYSDSRIVELVGITTNWKERFDAIVELSSQK